MKLCDAIAQWCVAIDTPFVAGIPASGIIDVIESLTAAENVSFPFVLTRHEQSAAMMASSYAFHTHRPAVVMASKGPGATNLAIGVMGAFVESLPMVVITMQASNEHDQLEAFEEIDLAEFFKAITKWSVQANNAKRVMSMLDEAWRRCLAGRPGPVHVAIPYNFMNQDVGEFVAPVLPVPASSIAADTIEQAVQKLVHAARPLIIAGGGVAASAEADLLGVSEALQVPIVASWLRKPVSDRHPNLVGMAGIGGSPAACTAIRRADVVLALGCRFSEQMTEHYRMHFAQDVQLVHVDLDSAVIGRVFPATIGMVADAGDVLPQMRAHIAASGARPAPGAEAWLGELRAEHAAYRRRLDAQATPAPHLGGREVVRELRKVLPSDTKLILDSGNYLHWAEQYFPMESGGLFHYPTSGTMGYGIPGALGAKFAQPGSFVCALVGDGGFAMTMGELETARRIQVPILVVIVNNDMLGHIRMRQDQRFGRHDGSVFTPPQNFENVPKAFNIPSVRVDTLQAFIDILPEAIRSVESGTTYVIDAHVTNELAPGPLDPWWKES